MDAMLRSFVAAFALAAACAVLLADDAEASTYWVADLSHRVDDTTIFLSNVGTDTASATIYDATGAVTPPVSIPTGATFSYKLSNRLVETEVDDAGAYRIETTGAVIAQSYSADGWYLNNDASYLLDEDAGHLGTKYYAYTYDPTLGTQGLQNPFYSFITVIATQDNTQVTIYPTAPVLPGLDYRGATPTPAPSGPFTVTLDRNEVYQIASHHDLTGSFVDATLPVAVFSGDECSNIKDTASSWCDQIHEQLLPVDVFAGDEFVVCSLDMVGLPNVHDLVRIIATEPGTIVQVTPGTTYGPLNPGDVVSLPNNVDHLLVEATSGKVHVGMYVWKEQVGGSKNLMADPAWVALMDVDLWQVEHTFYVPAGWAKDEMMVATHSGGTIPGVTGWAGVPSPGGPYQCGMASVPDGLNQYTSSQPAQVQVFGYLTGAKTWGSYWYRAPIAPCEPELVQIQMQPEDAGNPDTEEPPECEPCLPPDPSCTPCIPGVDPGCTPCIPGVGPTCTPCLPPDPRCTPCLPPDPACTPCDLPVQTLGGRIQLMDGPWPAIPAWLAALLGAAVTVAATAGVSRWRRRAGPADAASDATET